MFCCCCLCPGQVAHPESVVVPSFAVIVMDYMFVFFTVYQQTILWTSTDNIKWILRLKLM